ncbi:MAG: 2Fe-2S iron-sulfur cluster-binding protein [Burkholderiales bacterium]
MAQWLTLSRAARLIGVPRGELQRAIREGRLPANDGLVSTEGLLALYPSLPLEDAGAFERVARIKEEAFGRRVAERVLPAREVLVQRLYEQSAELADAKRHLSRYHELVTAVQARIDTFIATKDARALDALRGFIAQGLAQVLATPSADALVVMDDVLKVMSAHVTLRPSGHEFFVEGRDTLLEAGLKAGLPLDYGCGNGTCGLCKARLVSGEVVKVAPNDYPMSEAERQAGHILLCVQSPSSSEIVLETLVARGPGDIPDQLVAARVRGVQALGADTRLLHLQTARSSRLRFLAGQAATLATEVEGREISATYPIASCPCEERNLHFHIPRDDSDYFAALVFDGGLVAGSTVTLGGPVGDFVLHEPERRLVFLACDTDFAPVKSLIEHAMALDRAEDIAIGWLATRSDGHYLANQCRAWSEAFDHFHYVAREAGDAEEGAPLLVDDLDTVQALADSDVYIAGPRAFVEAARRSSLERGATAERTFWFAT